MTLGHWTSIVDAVILAILVLLTGDGLRIMNAATKPAKAACFVLICVGAFGWVLYDLSYGKPVAWWMMALHAGVTGLAVLVHEQKTTATVFRESLPKRPQSR